MLKYFRILKEKVQEIKQDEFARCSESGAEVFNIYESRSAIILSEQIKCRLIDFLKINPREDWITCDECKFVEEPVYFGEGNDEGNPDEDATESAFYVSVTIGTYDPMKHAFAKKIEKSMFKGLRGDANVK